MEFSEQLPSASLSQKIVETLGRENLPLKDRLELEAIHSKLVRDIHPELTDRNWSKVYKNVVKGNYYNARQFNSIASRTNILSIRKKLT